MAVEAPLGSSVGFWREAAVRDLPLYVGLVLEAAFGLMVRRSKTLLAWRFERYAE